MLLKRCYAAVSFAMDSSRRGISFLASSPEYPSREVFEPLAFSSPKRVSVRAIRSTTEASDTSLLIYAGYSQDPAADPERDGKVTNHNTTDNLPPSISQATSFAVLDRDAFQLMIDEALATYSLEEEEFKGCSTKRNPRHCTAGPLVVGCDRSSDGSESSLATDVVSMQAPNHLTRELHRLLRESESELAPLLKVKAPIDAYIDRVYYPLLVYSYFGLFALHFVIYFNWIFFVFDWNLVEPTTYFLGYTGVFFALVFHYMRCDVSDDEFTHKHFLTFIAEKRRAKLYRKSQLDESRVRELEVLIKDVKRELHRS
ncbi:unnamed protein product [Phytomonas sp. EM1]|nr:unnamed protein product [Phytomonas sp. EM1]|eukprot:CCW61886.1 unnamed protein product [Phytomonas sp. isolate EM1]